MQDLCKNLNRQVAKAGYKVVYSSSWYLDNLDSGFDDFYSRDPRQMVIDISKDPKLAELVVGGEACMWAEMADDNNLISR